MLATDRSFDLVFTEKGDNLRRPHGTKPRWRKSAQACLAVFVQFFLAVRIVVDNSPATFNVAW